MRPRRVLHVYGSVAIPSDYCEDCKTRAFIVQGKFTCCGAPGVARRVESFKVEVDAVGAKRKIPGVSDQAKILHFQRNRCFYCGDEFGTCRVLNGKSRRVVLHWDHVVPFSYNGNNNSFVAACRDCNQLKSDGIFDSLADLADHLTQKINEKKTARR